MTMTTSKKGHAGNLAALVAALVAIAGTDAGAAVTVTDGILAVDIASGSREYTADELSAINASPSEVTTIVKTGAGTLVSKGIARYAGAIEVAAGVLELTDATGLGTAAGGTTVASGATLAFGGPGIGQGCRQEPLTLAGSPTADAIRVTAGVLFLEDLTLTGDATIRCANSLYLGTASGGTIDMGGHTLTLSGPSAGDFDGHFGFSDVRNPGCLTAKGFRSFCPSAAFSGGAGHVLSLSDRTHVRFSGLDNGSNWTLRMDGTGGIYAQGAKNVWEGPVELGSSDRTFHVMDNGDLWLKGPISGSANMWLSAPAGSDTPRLSLFGTNAFTGTLTLAAGSVYLATPMAVPSLTATPPQFAATANGDSLIVEPRADAGPDGWTADEIWSYVDTFRTFGRARPHFKVNVPAGEVCTLSHDFNGENYSVQRIGTTGGDLRLVSSLAGAPRFRILSDGSVTLSSAGPATAENTLGTSYVDAGSLVLRDLGFVNVGLSDLYLNGTADAPARLAFAGKTVAGLARQGRLTPQVDVTHAADGRGTLEVADGALVTNKVMAGLSEGQCGLVRICGGVLRNTGCTGNTGTFGGAGQAAVVVTSGALELEGHTQLGASATGFGVLRQTGGAVTVESERLAVGEAGVGVLYQAGGVFLSKVALPVCAPGSGAAAGGEGCVTFAGRAQATVREEVSLAGRDGGVATLNLNDGAVLETPRVCRVGTAGGNAAYVNFNGGTVRTTGTQVNVLGAGATCPTRTTVFAGGAAFDVGGGQEIWLSTPLVKPEGKGLVGPVAVPGAPLAGYFAPPRVIVTGDGTGATAVADFDFETGAVTGVTVTSPGWGYTSATVTLTGGGAAADVSWAVTPTSDAGTGGLTKRGDGLLRLAAASTYAGPTVVAGGSVRLGVDGALPDGSELVLKNGATVYFNDKLTHLSRVVYGVGGGTLAETGAKVTIDDASPSFVITADELIAGQRLEWTGDIDYSEVTLTLVGDLNRLTEDPDRRYLILAVSDGHGTGTPNVVSGAVPDGWAFSVTARGVSFRRDRGLMLLVR